MGVGGHGLVNVHSHPPPSLWCAHRVPEWAGDPPHCAPLLPIAQGRPMSPLASTHRLCWGPMLDWTACAFLPHAPSRRDCGSPVRAGQGCGVPCRQAWVTTTFEQQSYGCMPIHAHTSTYIHTRTHTCTYMLTRVLTHTHTHTHDMTHCLIFVLGVVRHVFLLLCATCPFPCTRNAFPAFAGSHHAASVTSPPKLLLCLIFGIVRRRRHLFQ